MKTKVKDGALASDESEHVPTPGKDRAPVARKRDRGRAESASGESETVAPIREQSVSKRKPAVRLRENAVVSRETGAALREDAYHPSEEAESSGGQEKPVAESAQAASEDHLAILQQTTAQLALARLEAAKLTDQILVARNALEHLAHRDTLTDLPNRALLQDRLNQAIELARRDGRQLAVMVMDLDKFEYINESLGRAIGDQLLQAVAQRLGHCVRQSDTISRHGGDEFAVVLTQIDHPEDAAHSAQKILAALARPHRIDRHELQVSASLGISIYPDDGQNAETLIKSADNAMYHAKESGRNNYKFFGQGMNDWAVERRSIEMGLRRALEQNEFLLHYQPKVDLPSGATVGVEALIRWQHPDLGLVEPAQFMHIAEDSGLIVPIGRWVLREACFQNKAWQRAGLPPITISVNTSALELHDKDFLPNVHATLDETGLNPRYLEIELTESVLMRDAESSDSLLLALADLGVKLAVDDFGTGYSSLSYLRRFPIHTVKIDQSFVNHITTNPDDATIVSAVIGMGKNLEQHVIAEGVETPEQHAFLLAHDCDQGQGYYFGRPMEAESLAILLEAGSLPAVLH